MTCLPIPPTSSIKPADELLSVNSGLTTTSVLSPGQRIQIPPFPSSCGGTGYITLPPTNVISSCRGYIVQQVWEVGGR